MKILNEKLTTFSKQVQLALYGLPNFSDKQQRVKTLTLKLQLILSQYLVSTQIYCTLQIGYFKAKNFSLAFLFKIVPYKIYSSVIKFFRTIIDSIQAMDMYTILYSYSKLFLQQGLFTSNLLGD